MATKVVMEALSPTMEEGRLVKWRVAAGAPVKQGDVLAEIETDKAVMELVARGDGVLRSQLLAEGDTAPVGQLVAVIAAPDEDIASLLAAAASPLPTTAATGVTPATSATPTEPAAPVTAAAAPGPAVPSPLAPSAPLPTPRPVTTRAPARPVPPAASDHPTSGNGGRGQGSGRVRSSPLARRLATARGLDVSAITGTGPNGRVIRRDIEAAASAPAAPASTPPPTRPRVIPAEGDWHDVPLTQLRKTIARRLAESNGPVPTFYLTADFDVERLVDLRTAMAAQGAEYRVSVNDILIKAVATALAQHPEVNAHWLGDRIRYFNRVHVGMAVAVEDGLIAPVLFDADTKGLRQIAEESRSLAARARARSLTPPEYTGATFSVSNLGMFGIDQFTAIINPPEAGILAVGAVEPRAVVVEGEGRGDRGRATPHARDHELRPSGDRWCDRRAIPPDPAPPRGEPPDDGLLIPSPSSSYASTLPPLLPHLDTAWLPSM